MVAYKVLWFLNMRVMYAKLIYTEIIAHYDCQSYAIIVHNKRKPTKSMQKQSSAFSLIRPFLSPQ